MNVWPMILRLRSGSVTPASLSMNRSAASTNSSGSLSFSANRCRICVASLRRSTPLSTKTHVSRSPIARWMITAATVESTPPLSAQMTRPWPTCARIRAVASSMNEAIVQSPVQPQTPNAKLRRISSPRSVCTTSGMEQQAVEAASRILDGGDRRVGAGGDDGEPVGRGLDVVAVAGPHAQLVGQRGEQRGRLADVTCTIAWPNSRCAAGATRPPSESVISCMP